MFERRLREMEWTLPSPKWIFVFNILLFLLRVSLAKTLATIHWDKNSNFGTDGLIVQAEINDVVEIECPKTPNTTTGREFAQYLTFTQVSRDGFETCSTSRIHGNVRLLLLCNRPFEDNSYLLLFRQDSPFPGGLTFVHSSTYYFITTSDGTLAGLHQTQGGLCATHHMRVKVHIKPGPTEAVPTNPSRVTSPSVSTTTVSQSTTQPTTQPWTTTVTPTRTTKPAVKMTKKPPMETEAKKDADPQFSQASPRLRHSPLLLLVSFCIAMLRWYTTP